MKIAKMIPKIVHIARVSFKYYLILAQADGVGNLKK